MAEQLVVFDFDNTLVDGNTDSLILDMLPMLRNMSMNYEKKGQGWGEVMNSALETIAQNGLGKADVDKCILALEISEPVKSMISTLMADKRTDLIILSHSNEYFIDILLLEFEIDKSKFNGIFTYPAEWNDEEQLRVRRFYEEKLECRYCPNDFCKGYFLTNFIASVEQGEKKQYSRRIYVGDGRADYCAALSLGKSDTVLYRHGYALHRLISLNSENNGTCKSNDNSPEFVCWKDFEEMKEKLIGIINSSLVFASY